MIIGTVSMVTNVLVLTLFPETVMERLTRGETGVAWYDGDGARFVNLAGGDLARAWVGPKGPECAVYGAAFNHFDRASLLATLETADWNDRAAVQLLIRHQDDDCWGLWMFQGSRLREVEL